VEKIRQERNLNVPNMLTALRIILLPVYVRCYLAGNYTGTLAVFAAVVVSDLLDGVIARRWNQITYLGKLMDPLADKLMLLTVLICFGLRGRLEWWMISLILCKETLMIVGSVFALRKKIVVAAMWIGKAATALFASAVLGKLLSDGIPALNTVSDVLFYVAVVVTFTALAVYIRNLLLVTREQKDNTYNACFVTSEARQQFQQKALCLFCLLQGIAWAVCFGILWISSEGLDWAWAGNLLGSSALLWSLIVLFLVYPRYATPRGMRTVARLWMAVAPVVLLAVVEWLHTGPAMFASTGTAIAMLGFAAMMSAVFALCGRSLPAQISVALLWWLMALVSNIKLAFRGTPLVPWDVYALTTALEVTEGYTPYFTIEMAGSLLGLVLYCAVCWRYRLRQRGLVRRTLALALSLCILGGTGSALLFPSFPLYLNLRTHNWELHKLYEREGFLTAMIINCRQLIIPKPDGYEPDSLSETLAQAKAPKPPAVMSEPPVNIVVIMSEAFADLEELTSIKTTRPVLENLRTLSESGLYGQVHVSIIGGGTSIPEFELLTGHTSAFLPVECAPYVQYMHPTRRNGYSLAWLLKEQGYRTVAVHPAGPRNWNRNNAYAMMGFDLFLSHIDMPGWDDPANNLRYLYADEPLFEELHRLLREKPPGQRLFIHCVTMQNHGGYLQPPMDGLEPRIDLAMNELPKDEQVDLEIGNYLTLIGISDHALGEFTRALEEIEEPTLLLFFGDHHPTLSRRLTLRVEGEDRWFAEPEARAELYKTPLLIWSNQGLPAVNIGDISPQYLGVLLTQIAGLPLSDYQRFLAALSAEWPVFTTQAARDAAGVFYATEEALKASPELREYQAIQYNLLLDDRNKLYSYPTGM